MQELLAHQDQQQCDQAMADMAKSDTWWVPTLQVLEISTRAQTPTLKDEARLDYVPGVIKQFMWYPDLKRHQKLSADAQDSRVVDTVFQQALEHVNAAHKAGVHIMAGTDSGDTFVFAGSSMHDELSLMVKAGLSPAAALKAATFNAAKFAEMEKDSGSIAQGKIADIVILNANPLEDIEHIRQVEGVIFNGHYFDKQQLAQMKQLVLDYASSINANVKLLASALKSPTMRVQIYD